MVDGDNRVIAEYLTRMVDGDNRVIVEYLTRMVDGDNRVISLSLVTLFNDFVILIEYFH